MPVYFIVIMICAAIGAYGLQEVMAYAGKARPTEPIRSVRNATEGQIMVWQRDAPRGLRRRYVVSQYIAYAGVPVFLYGLWNDERFPQQAKLVISIGVFGIGFFQVARLTLNLIRHGF